MNLDIHQSRAGYLLLDSVDASTYFRPQYHFDNRLLFICTGDRWTFIRKGIRYDG